MKRLGPFLLLGLFGSGVLSAWAWFNVGPAPASAGQTVVVQTNITGYRFAAEPIGKTALVMLGEPEVLNGTFYLEVYGTSDRSPFRVFSARWPADRKVGLNVVQHTPDICWVGSGWIPISIGQPEQIGLELPMAPGFQNHSSELSSRLRFECRAFQSPDRKLKELVLWCTLIGGQVLPESSRFRSSIANVSAQREGHQEERQLAAGRRLTADYFVQSVRKRLRARGVKQFLRVSTPVDGDLTEAVESLKQFTSQWLAVGAVPSNRTN